MKKVIVISTSLRAHSNSDMLADKFVEGALQAGHEVEKISLIGKDIRLEPVRMTKQDPIGTILSYYMGKNTNDRQDFIIDNLYVENDEI